MSSRAPSPRGRNAIVAGISYITIISYTPPTVAKSIEHVDYLGIRRGTEMVRSCEESLSTIEQSNRLDACYYSIRMLLLDDKTISDAVKLGAYLKLWIYDDIARKNVETTRSRSYESSKWIWGSRAHRVC
jgi:hypothetical protein